MTPFLTLEDPNARIKGSRDPLGAQPIWSKFARHVVTNVTAAANSVRGFSILLLGRYYAASLIDAGAVAPERALDVVLRMEQMGAYARYVGHGVEGDIRGIERVKQFTDANGRNVFIETTARGLILSDQRVYGLWGLYSVSARESGLIPQGPHGVTDSARALIEREYLPRLRPIETPLRRLLARGGRLSLRRSDPTFAALCDILPERYTPHELEYFGRTLRDGLDVPDGHRGRQAIFARLLADHTDLSAAVSRREIAALAKAAKRTDEVLAECLRRILSLEALLAPADALFDYVLTQGGQHPAEVATVLRGAWGRALPNLDLDAFEALLAEIESASTRAQATAMKQCHAALASGKYEEAIGAVLAWNAEVMRERKAAAWARLGDRGHIDVRYRGAERRLPEEGEIPTLWRNQYFIDSLKRITLQLRSAA